MLKSNVKKIKQKNTKYVKNTKRNIKKSSHKIKDYFNKAKRPAKNMSSSSFLSIKLILNVLGDKLKNKKSYKVFGLVFFLYGKLIDFAFALLAKLFNFLLSKTKTFGGGLASAKNWLGFAKRACVACLVGGFLAFYLYAPVQVFYCQCREKARLNTELEIIKDINEDIKQEIYNLHTLTGIEDYAREKLGWVKDGENGLKITGLPQEQKVNANLKNQEYKAPTTCYSWILDGLFGYKQGE
ncbi:MAG: septum formation initiator family protein [Eggerthellaceae bacterium]|nr:septum formation initiator family protein [Eggerthellaceae bacterium]